MIRRILKPWFVFRPLQIMRRIAAHKSQSNLICLPWGGEIEVDATKEIGRSLLHTGVYDLAMSELLFRLADVDDSVVDVGANVGYVTALFAHRVGAHGRVFSIEAHPNVYEKLLKNVALIPNLNAKSIDVRNCAVTEQSGHVHLEESEGFIKNDGIARVVDRESATSFSVLGVPLDEIIPADLNIKVMKIDVEGHELSVLRGAQRCLRNQIVHVVYEDHGEGISPVTELLISEGFKVYQIGWRLLRLIIVDIEMPSPVNRYEPRNLIATKDPEYLFSRCLSAGWRVLGR